MIFAKFMVAVAENIIFLAFLLNCLNEVTIMTCYKSGGCGVYENRSCSECPASKPEYLNRNNKLKEVTGLYPKYTVTNNQTGLEVYDCFVLKPMSDESAKLALLYYADICDNEALKNDIKAWLNSK